MSEIWKDIKGFEGIYQVSNTGKVRSFPRKVWNYTKPGRILKPHDNGHSYLNVRLVKEGYEQKHAYIHRLVAEAFIPNPENKEQINHLDFDKSNNHVDNLKWATRTENIRHYRNTPFQREVIKEVVQTRERIFDIKVFKYKDQIISLYDEGHTINDIKKKLNIGRDFTVRVLRMHGRLK